MQPACASNDSILINKLISNLELVSGLMQQSVDTLIKIHRENNAFNILSEIKSMYQLYITKKAPFALQRLKTKLGTLESFPTKAADNFTVDSCADSDKVESIIYSKTWGETKLPVDADVTTDNPSLISILSPAHDVVLSDNAVTAAGTALSNSAPVVLQCSVANLSQPSDVLVHSQAKSDRCEPVDNAIVCANSMIDVDNNNSETFSSDISLNM